ncbi:MAG: hypothetical protein A3D24_03985 [Candidatus Blackburnbacteria bacterium RIFCSPHIGHO2_02_FULL_39_13]|uniref:Uncharacterized protein n=1 Tax=Candidatus Blackburnbacteria bacterium RIFCSPLOWO2_01_FULL_40_20 TaxID=1797519 RepID=A0A1G1VD26_9BACT|nr:MAG: hypothetical protein A2694_02480 [Candidatus Blackburnbacteria bacterium RIFCSPHIGHO2_01_FULL_40_17]OGY09628.1 MAG: hypothetical protein A3D24_03985 [Candidatus Blackburnbacteria bacterium RIFCSPHIGHO2_02_FULL_39_13]OGY13217.1 MAG: hypothetical protein A3A77_01430 [Candidatus Blackburnbacteria bacterium RIFCSPLOWO2_01_FULL_40_20]HBL52372.1 hypothetical protein [Candidatus Blackburnbacteria bacterium]
MRKYVVALLVGMILVLDWAALDDITTGNEPNHAGEYAVLALSALIFIFLGIRFFQRIRGK